MPLDLDSATYQTLSESEKSVIDYIDQNVDKVASFSITMLARKTFTSAATVSRAIRKAGYPGGIVELRAEIASKKPNTQVRSMDDIYVGRVNEILSKSYRECIQTLDNIKITDIIKAIQLIKKARRIVIAALGTSARIAREFQEQLYMIGYNPIVIDDEVWMLRSHVVGPDDLLIIISAQNTRPALFEIASHARKVGAPVLTLICKEGTNLQEISELTIVGHTEPICDTSIMSTTSRLPLAIITRTIIEYLAREGMGVYGI